MRRALGGDPGVRADVTLPGLLRGLPLLLPLSTASMKVAQLDRSHRAWGAPGLGAAEHVGERLNS